MMSKVEKDLIIVNEGVWRSVIKDGITFIMFFGLMYFNHRVLSGRLILDLIFVFLIILGLATRQDKKSIHHFNSKKDAIKYLEAL